MPDDFDFFGIARKAQTPARSTKPFRSHTRFSVGLADAETVSAIMAAIMTVPNLDEVNRMRALFGGPPLQPGEAAPGVKAAPTGTHPDLEVLRSGLKSATTTNANGVVAFPRDAPVPMFWGLDHNGDVAALVCDFERLRVRHFDFIDVSLKELQREVSINIQGLTLGSSPDPIKISGPATARWHSVTVLLGEARVTPPTKERHRHDGTREIELHVSDEERRRGTLRIQLHGRDRPARRIVAS